MSATPQSAERRFVRNSLLFLLPNLLVKGLSFLLTPVYARSMTAQEYGIVGLATTQITLLGTVLGLALFAAYGRIYFDCKTDEARRRLTGTLLGSLLVAPPLLTFLLDLLGAAGWLAPLSSLPFAPHLRLVIWTSLLTVYPALASSLLASREEPGRLALLSVLTAGVQVIATIGFVVVLGQGSVGVLRAGLWSGLLSSIASIAIVASHAAAVFDSQLFWRSLRFSLPVLPHLVSNWALAVSDRLVLERHVAKEVIGQYSLAYLFSFVVTMVVGAVLSAFNPIAQRTLAEHAKATVELKSLSTFGVVGFTFVSVAAVLLGRDAVTLFLPNTYHSAIDYVAPVVLGAYLQGVSLVVAQATWFSQRTTAVAGITIGSAVLNVSLNLLLVPSFGASAAAWMTALSGAVLLLAHGVIAHSLMRLKWPYWAWSRTALVGLTCVAVGLFASRAGPELALLADTACVFIGFPIGLTLVGVTTPAMWRTAFVRH